MKRITEEVLVYLETELEDRALREILHKHGWKWSSGMSLLDISMRCNGKVLAILPNKRVLRGAAEDFAISYDEFLNEYCTI